MKNKKLLDDEYIQEVFKYYLKNDNYLKDAL